MENNENNEAQNPEQNDPETQGEIDSAGNSNDHPEQNDPGSTSSGSASPESIKGQSEISPESTPHSGSGNEPQQEELTQSDSESSSESKNPEPETRPESTTPEHAASNPESATPPTPESTPQPHTTQSDSESAPQSTNPGSQALPESSPPPSIHPGSAGDPATETQGELKNNPESETPISQLTQGKQDPLPESSTSETAAPTSQTQPSSELIPEIVPGSELDKANQASEDDPEAELEGAEDLAQVSLQKAVSSSFILLQTIMAVILFLVVAEGFQYIEEGTVGVKQRFGRYVRDDQGKVVIYRAQSKFVFVLPYPIEQLQVIPLSSQTLNIDKDFWPLVDKAKAVLQDGALPKQSNLNPSKDGYNLTADFNIVHSQWQIEYQITDPVTYLLSAAGQSPEETTAAMRNLIRFRVASSILRTISGTKVTDVLTGDVSEAIIADIKRQFAENPCGVKVDIVNTVSILPPGITQEAFNEVTSAQTRQKTLENNAQSAANTILGQARVQAKNRIFAAEVNARRRLERARADAEALKTLLKKFPNKSKGLRVYLQQWRQSTMQDVLSLADIQTQPQSQPGSIILGPTLNDETQNGQGGNK